MKSNVGRPGTPSEALPHISLESLRSLVTSQRWFAGKSRQIDDLQVQSLTRLGELFVVVLLRVVYADGEELYFLPLKTVDGKPQDGLSDIRLSQRLLEIIAREESLPSTRISGRPAEEGGTLSGERSALFQDLGGQTFDPEKICFTSHDQSNSAMTIDNCLFLKIFRKLEPGVNPDFEISHFLTQQGRFTRLPRLAGALHFHTPGSPPMTLATLQELVANEGSAWDAMLAAVQSSLAAGTVQVPESVELLGRRTAELHNALAAETEDPAFAPEPLSIDDCEALSLRLRRESAAVFAALNAATMPFPQSIAAQIASLLERGPALVDQFSSLLASDPKCVKTRIHGDYHLGQVLCQQDDFIILDFEGEPARSLAERRAKDSPLRDVAGMLRSFGYVAYAGLFAISDKSPADFARLDPLAVAWQKTAARMFLNGYLAEAQDKPYLPADPQQLASLLDFFVVEKAIYEVQYELNNRPTWLNIPLAGILAIADAPVPESETRSSVV